MFRLGRVHLSVILAVLLASSACFAVQQAVRPADVAAEFRGAAPREWGERCTGVKTRLATRERVIALTFDACGRDYARKPVSEANDYDAVLIDFLCREKIPATLFLNARWITAHPTEARKLSDNPLFEIENHGMRHCPLSVTGRKAYRIAGTASPEEALHEILAGADAVGALTGKPARFFRPGTAYCDDVGVRMCERLGYAVMGYSLLGDAGATFSAAQVKHALLSATPGQVALLHMNHPAGGTAAGVRDAIPVLRSRGFRFVRLSEIPLE